MADILSNPKARRDYHILETFEAGIVLRGTGVTDAVFADSPRRHYLRSAGAHFDRMAWASKGTAVAQSRGLISIQSFA